MTTRIDLFRQFTKLCTQHGVEPDAFGNGAIDAKVAIVSETYGEAEMQSAASVIGRIGFAGGSGSVLWEQLSKKCRLSRQMVWLTNVIKSQQHFYTMKLHTPSIEFEAWRQILLWELEQLPNLEVVLILGAAALKALTGEVGIGNWRGSLVDVQLPSRTVLGFATFNPTFTLRKITVDGITQLAEPRNEIIFNRDMSKFGRLLQEGDKRKNRTFHLWPTKKDALEWIAHLHDYSTSRNKPIAYDIEVQQRKVVCIGMSADPMEGFCVNWAHVNGGNVVNQFSEQDEVEVRLALGKLLSDPRIKLVAQNGDYDRSVLWFVDRMRINATWFDTMLAEHLLHPTGWHGLDHIASVYTWEPYYKSEKTTFYHDPDAFFRYNLKDACVTREVCATQLSELTKKGLRDFFFGHTMRLQPHLQQAQVLGIPIDNAQLEMVSTKLHEELEELRAKFVAACAAAISEPIDVNPLSTKQVGEFLQRLGVVFGRRTATGKPSLNKEAIASLNNYYSDDPHIPQILQTRAKYVTEHTHITNFVDMKLDGDGYFRAAYSEQGTREAPGRLSSSKTHWGTGRNIQNIPHRADWIFVAPKGFVFIYIDLEQAEARYVGWDWNIEEWIKDFERARREPGTFDCHRQLAAMIYNIPYEDIPEEDFLPDGSPSKRFIGKRSRHGLNYRLGPDTFAEKNGLPLSVAQFVYAKYHSMFPQIRKGWRRIENEMRANRVIYNSYGRPLYIEEQLTTEALKSIVAFRPQSTIGDKMKRAWYIAAEDDDWPDHARIIRNVHDALYAIAPAARAKDCLRIMIKHAEEPINVGPFPLIIPAAPKMSVPDESGVHRFSTLKKVML